MHTDSRSPRGPRLSGWMIPPLLFCSSLLVFATGAAAEPAGLCRPITQDTGCTCSLSSIATPMSFGQAAELLLVSDRADPGDHNEQLLGELFRQCSGGRAASALPKVVANAADRAGQPSR